MKQLKAISLFFLFFLSQQLIGMQSNKPPMQTRHFFTDLLQRYDKTHSFDLESKSKDIRNNLRDWAAYTQETGADEIARELNIDSRKLTNIIKWLQAKLREFDAVDAPQSAHPVVVAAPEPVRRPDEQTRHFFIDQLNNFQRTGRFDLASKGPRTLDDIYRWVDYSKKSPAGIYELLAEVKLDAGVLYLRLTKLQDELRSLGMQGSCPAAKAAAQPIPAAAQPLVRPTSPARMQEQVFLFNPQDSLVLRRKPLENGMLLQINTVSQFDPELAKYGYATCPVNAVRNALLVETYSNTGRSIKNQITDVNNARAFMESVKKCTQSLEWFDDDAVQNIVNKSHGQLQVNPDQVSVISSVLALQDKMSPKQKDIEKMRRGLQQQNYAHAIIVGTLDDDYYAHRNYHYFALNIIKKGPEIQYIVTDTAHEPNNPMVGRDHTIGFDNLRLNYLIDMIRNGKSSINIDKEAQEAAKRGILPS